MNICITGSTGFLGTHLMTHLETLGYSPYGVTHKAYDLRNPGHIKSLFKHTGHIDILFHLAAHVGGIQYNIDHPGKLFYDNVMMSTQLIHQAVLNGVGKFVMIGSVCSYPAFNPVPTSEHCLWNGYPEESNGAYGIAKLVALEQLKAYHHQYSMNFAYPVLSNLYGPGDNFGDNAHVIPALIKKFVEGPDKITIWGDGVPTRDFLYVEDAVRALARFIEVNYCEPVNIAGGVEISIRQLVELLKTITGYTGKIEYDQTRPNGQLRRSYDTYKARQVLGWQAQTEFETGLKNTIASYRDNLR